MQQNIIRLSLLINNFITHRTTLYNYYVHSKHIYAANEQCHNNRTTDDAIILNYYNIIDNILISHNVL